MSYTCEVNGVRYKAVEIKSKWCKGCVGAGNPLCNELPDCTNIIWILDETKPESELTRLRAENAELRERLEAAERDAGRTLEALKAMRSACFDRRKANEEFERLGDLYYREFGRLRPGKDDPFRDSCDQENTDQYNEWSQKRKEAALDLADAAIDTIAAAKGEV